MAIYTENLYNIDKSDIFDFDFTLYGADATEQAQHKQAFIDRFYKYYYFKEINGDTIYAFNRRLEEVMNEWLAKFNVLFSHQKYIEENVSDLIQKRRSHNITNTGTITDEFDTITNERTSKYLDTPQTPYNATDEDDYATSINKDSNDVNTTNERTLDTLQENVELEDDVPVVEGLDLVYKKYHDLDMDLIKKFKSCFLMIY